MAKYRTNVIDKLRELALEADSNPLDLVTKLKNATGVSMTPQDISQILVDAEEHGWDALKAEPETQSQKSDTSLAGATGRPKARPSEVRASRRRTTRDGTRQRLVADQSRLDTGNFMHRWIRSDDQRIFDMTQNDDWDIVQGANAATGEGGKSRNTTSSGMTLVKKPIEYHNKDREDTLSPVRKNLASVNQVKGKAQLSKPDFPTDESALGIISVA